MGLFKIYPVSQIFESTPEIGLGFLPAYTTKEHISEKVRILNDGDSTLEAEIMLL